MKTEYVEGKRKQNAVPRIAWPALGFTDSMTLEQARARARQINALNRIEKYEAKRVAGIAVRVERDRLHHSAFVPEDLNQQFLKWLEENVSPKQVEKTKIVWGTTKRAMIHLQITPEHMAANKRKIYMWIASQEYSVRYAKDIIRLMNYYRDFVGRLLGKYFERLPQPKGHDRELINDAYLDSAGYLGASEPLTEELLATLSEKLPKDQWRWMQASLWLGLRPHEIKMILADRQNRYWRVEEAVGEAGTRVLWVYQPKLTSKPRPQRWKPIPMIYTPQYEALDTLVKGEARPPLARVLKRLLAPLNVTLYAGRKGFTDLMLEKGHPLEDISQWMGHSSLDMTWQKYKGRKVLGRRNIGR